MSILFMNSTMLVRLASCISAGFSGCMSLEANSSEYRQKSFPTRKQGRWLWCLFCGQERTPVSVAHAVLLPEGDVLRICLRTSAWLWLMGRVTRELALIRGLYTFKWKDSTFSIRWPARWPARGSDVPMPWAAVCLTDALPQGHSLCKTLVTASLASRRKLQGLEYVDLKGVRFCCSVNNYGTSTTC